jgi:O-antigen/teichoic acid export membrane protein
MIRLVAKSLLWRGLQFTALFGLNIAVAGVFGASGSGVIHFTVAVLSLMTLIGSANLEGAMTYYTSSGKIPPHRLLTLGWVWTLVLSGILVPVLLPWLEQITPDLPKGLTLPVSCFTAGALLTTYYTSLYYGQGRFRLPNGIVALVHFFLMGWLLLRSGEGTGLSPTIYLTAYCYMYLLQGVVLLAAFHLQHPGTLRWQWPGRSEKRNILQYALLLLAGNLLLFLLYRLDYWMLMYGLPEEGRLEAIGNYIQASKMGHLFILFSGMAGTAVFAGTAASNREEDPAGTAARLIRIILFGGLLLFLLFLPLAPWGFVFLFGESFREAGSVFLTLFPGIIGIMTASITANYLAGKGRARYNAIGVALGLVLIVAGNLLWISKMGIYGAALSSCAGYLLYSGFMLAVFKSVSGIHWSRIFDGKSDFRLVQGYWQRKKKSA